MIVFPTLLGYVQRQCEKRICTIERVGFFSFELDFEGADAENLLLATLLVKT